METALFINFSDEAFTGYWDGKGKTFAPGQSLYLPDYLARHFAKHLVNRELLREDKNGDLLIKNGDKFVSPKKPEDVPVFMEMFNKAYKVQEATEDLGSNKDDIDTLIDTANKNRKKEETPQAPTPTEKEDDGTEDTFEGAPVDPEADAKQPGEGDQTQT